MKNKMWIILIFSFLLFFQKTALTQQASRPNVLFIAVDDLNDWIGPLDGYKGVKTPNIDKLARQGMNFTRAYCAAPLCNPSRVGLLTGVRPSTSGVYLNQHPWRPVMKNVVTLPQHFMANGYDVVGAGKIFHETFHDSASWRKFYHELGAPRPDKVPMNGFGNFDWAPLDAKDEEMEDYRIVQHGIDYLNEKHDSPFFLAIGLRKPHLPWYVPKKYFDLYPLESIVIPQIIENDLSDIPTIGKQMAHVTAGVGAQDHKFILENNKWKNAIQGYLASISSADAELGRLLQALDKSDYKKNTIIVFWGDHGWHLGEKEHWRKFALWEEAIRSPLIIVAPDIVKPNSVCERVVSLMDIYPTLIELCGLPKMELEARNISPLLKNPKLEWNYPAITTYGRNNHSIRTEKWHYIRYNDNSEELYDHNKDPYEWKNLASDPKYTETIKNIAVWLPKINATAVPPDSTILRRQRQMMRDTTAIKN